MKNAFLSALACISLFSGCTTTSTKEKDADTSPKNKTNIDLLSGNIPKDFSAQTTDGSVFNSKDNKGKYWVIFVYDSGSLTKSESYDMVAELNNTYKLFGNKISMIGIAEGYSDDEPELKKRFEQAKFSFKQIDNTEGPNKENQFKTNVFCTPAKILINNQGKVIYNGCGGHTDTFDNKLDSLVKTLNDTQ